MYAHLRPQRVSTQPPIFLSFFGSHIFLFISFLSLPCTLLQLGTLIIEHLEGRNRGLPSKNQEVEERDSRSKAS